jgi:tetratricopeptide (TPR) repeat protein
VKSQVLEAHRGHLQQANPKADEDSTMSDTSDSSADTGLAMRLLKEAFELEGQGHFGPALDKAMAALQAFGEDRTGAAAALHLAGVLNVHLGRPDQAAEHLEAAVPLRASTGDREGLASLHQQRLELALGRRDLQLAERAAADLLAVHAQGGDREGEAAARHQLAQILLAAGQPEQALAHIERGLELSSNAGEEPARVGFLLLSGRVEHARGLEQRAEQISRQAVTLARTARKRAVLVDALLQRSVFVPPDEARALLEEALDGTELLKDLPRRAVLLGQLAQVEVKSGKHRAAVDRLRYQARTWGELGSREEQLEALHAASSLAETAGEATLALQVAKELVEACKEARHPGALAAATFLLGHRQLAVGDLNAAAAAFRASAHVQPLPEARGVALAMLGQVLQAGGMSGALEAFQGARNLLAGTDQAAQIEQLIAALEQG